MAEREYQRLTRGRQRRAGFISFGVRSSLWLGKDHLLNIDSSGYGERYKRFYFRDIQAITIRQTTRRRTLAIVIGIIGGLSGIIVIGAGEPVLRWIFGVVAALMTLLFIVNLAKGPASVCHLRTAVQEEELPSLNRLRRARRVLNRLRPLIVAAQGELSAEELRSNLASPPLQDAPPVIARERIPSPEAVKDYDGKFHAICFWLLLADVPLTGADLFVKSLWLDVSSAVLLLVTVFFLIAAIVGQQHTNLPAFLKRIPWVALALTVVFFAVAIGYTVVRTINDPSFATEDLDPLTDPVLLSLTVVSTVIWASLGAVGLVRLNRFRAGRAVVPSPPIAGQFTA